MITTLKLAGLSAVLSAGLLSGLAGPERQLTEMSSKVYQDRLGESSGAATSTISASATGQEAVSESVNRSAKGDRLSSPAKTALLAAAVH